MNATFPFTYLNTTDIKVFVNDVSVAFTFLNSSTVTPTVNPAAGAIVQVRRVTQKASVPVNFTDGSVLLEKDLDLMATYSLYLAQENQDIMESALSLNTSGQMDAQVHRIVNVSDGVASSDAATKGQVDAVVGSASAAAASAAAALATKAAINDKYYGALSVNPTVKPSGSPSTAGDEYFNTVSNLLFRFNGATWQASDINTTNLAAPGGSGLVRYTANATVTEQLDILFYGVANIAEKRFAGGAKVDGATNDSASIEAAAAFCATTGAYLFFPAGTTRGVLNAKGRYIRIKGAGLFQSTLKAIGVVAAVIDAAETADVRISPLSIDDLTIDGNAQAASCLDLRYRHMCNFKNVRFTGATAQNIKTKDTWLNRYEQCLTENAPIGLWLVGSNHRSKFDSMSFQGCTVWQVKAEQAGTLADGNTALKFSNCDFEFGGGGGIYLDVSDASFDDCYIGENITGTVMQVQAGNISVSGGTLFYGYASATFGIVTNGGKTRFDKVRIAGQTNPGFYFLVAGANPSSVKFIDCGGYTPVGGDQYMTGDFLDYGPQGTVYAERLGKNWSGQGNNVTFSSVVSGNQQTFTVLTAPGPTPLLGAKSTLVNNSKWQDGGSAYLVVVYSSSKACDLKLSAVGFGGAPSKFLGALPAAAGTRTYIKLDQTLDAGAYSLLELVQTSSVVGDSLTVMECFLSDARMLNKGAAGFGNLYKC